MKIGMFGSGADLQCKAVARELAALGAEAVCVQYDSLERGLGLSMEGGAVSYCGASLADVAAWYLRFIPAAYAPYLEKDDSLVLYEDWFVRYMQARERASFFVAWLLNLVHDGVPVVNPPQAASVLQYKPYQLHALLRLGAPIPRTVITNDPARARAFKAEVPEAIFKPVMGGATTETLDEEALGRLDQIKASPVIFQERIRGDDLRIMLVGDEIVSSVAIDTGGAPLDFRDDPVYSGGGARYHEAPLPPAIAELCRKAARACGLVFAGIDIKRDGDRYVFLELNSSPIYLDVEVKLGHPISRAIARWLVEHAAARR